MNKSPPTHPSKPAPDNHAKGKKRLSLALQGGGSHGAFTWGVMERLMKDGRIFIDGISGSSAGAVNGVVFADGFIKGGRQGSCEAMEDFWRQVSQTALLNPGFFRTIQTPAGNFNVDDTPFFQMFDMTTRLMSPYQFNPFDVNPLRDVLENQVDFEALRAHKEMRLFVSATNVRTSRSKIFRTKDLTVESLMASSCIPHVSPAVHIDGEDYWDGGYLGNPSIYPLIHECPSNDVLIVLVNPLHRNEVPTSAREILNRITEISFNATFLAEMSNYATITKLIDKGELKSKTYDRVNFHLIEAEAELASYSASSKMNTDWGFLKHLHDVGADAAEKWLAKNFKKIGEGSTVDVQKRFNVHGN